MEAKTRPLRGRKPGRKSLKSQPTLTPLQAFRRPQEGPGWLYVGRACGPLEGKLLHDMELRLQQQAKRFLSKVKGLRHPRLEDMPTRRLAECFDATLYKILCIAARTFRSPSRPSNVPRTFKPSVTTKPVLLIITNDPRLFSISHWATSRALVLTVVVPKKQLS